MSTNKISEAEMVIMHVLWQAESELTSAQLMSDLPQEKEWKLTTLLTLCKRLEQKNFIAVRKEGKLQYFRPAMTQKQYQAEQAGGFLKEVCSGSVKSFMAALYQQDQLSKQDITELKQWLEEL